MQKTISQFIERIHLYQDYFLENQLTNTLEEVDIKALKDLGLLKRGDDLKEIPCQNCDDAHFLQVRVRDGKMYCVCLYEDTDCNYLTSEDVATWNFDVETFLNQLGVKLGIETNVEKMKVQGLWQIGGFSKDSTRHNCYYYQGKQFEEAMAFIKKQPISMRRYVIFTNKQEVSMLETHSLLLIEVKELLSLKKKGFVFDKNLFDEYLINGFRNVIFTPKNGELIVNGRPISLITPSNPEYYFVNILWKNFNEPISHQKIKNYIYEKTGKDYEDDPQKLSHKQKSKIKGESSDPKLIDEIFQTTKDSDGNNSYIMLNPS